MHVLFCFGTINVLQSYVAKFQHREKLNSEIGTIQLNFQFFYCRTKTHENAPIFAGDGTDETCAMDVAVLIAFPCVFLIFNIVYWAAFHL